MKARLTVLRMLRCFSVMGFFAAVLAVDPISAGTSAVVPPVLAVRVQEVLGMRHGGSPYLASYRECLRAVRDAAGAWQKQRETRSQYFQRLDGSAPLRAAATALVKAFASGADANALRNKVIGSLTLRGRSVGSAERRWRYGQMLDRVQVENYLLYRAREMSLKRESSHSAFWARTALLLYAQDSIFGGAAAWGNWFNPSAFPQATVNEKMLRINKAQRHRLEQLYRESQRREQWLHTKGIAPIQIFMREASKIGGGPIPKRLLARFVGALSALIRKTDGRIDEQYFLLRCVIGPIRLLSSDGHHTAASEIRDALAKWSTEIHAEDGISVTDRKALLRWIKEASL